MVLLQRPHEWSPYRAAIQRDGCRGRRFRRRPIRPVVTDGYGRLVVHRRRFQPSRLVAAIANSIARRTSLYAALRDELSLRHAARLALALRKIEKPMVVHSEHFGGPIYVRPGTADAYTFYMLLNQREYDFDYGEPKVILDLGAHIGVAAVYFATRYPNARIICVEPDDRNFRLLQANTARFNNILAVRAAVWNRTEDVALVDPGFGTWGYQLGPPANGGSVVAGVTMDDLLDRFELDHVDLVKLDIEGSEKAVFSSSTRWLTSVDALVIELHDRLEPGCSRSFFESTRDFAVVNQSSNVVYVRREGPLSHANKPSPRL
jgi:FkbM family methyltransferase